MSRHWDGMELAGHQKKLADFIVINGYCLMDEQQKDCFKLLGISPVMDLSSKGLSVSTDELPQVEVLSWHRVVLFT